MARAIMANNMARYWEPQQIGFCRWRHCCVFQTGSVWIMKSLPFSTWRLHLVAVLLLLLIVRVGAEENTCESIGEDGSCEQQQQQIEDDCQDTLPQECEYWASVGECDNNPKYMLIQCRKSCKTCHHPNVHRLVDEKLGMATANDGNDNPDLTETPHGVRQDNPPGSPQHENVAKIIQEMENYMLQTVAVDPRYDHVREDCKNRHKQCAFWKALGECEKNPAYMTLQCAPTCQTCQDLDMDTRCPFDPVTMPDFLKQEGDLDRIFERIVNEDYYQRFTPQILSRPPEYATGVEDSMIPDGPWVIVLENFITDEEAQRLIDLGASVGYERSMDVGKKKFDGSFDGLVNDRRTSTNAWCQDDACIQDELTQQVLQRIENLTGVPDSHSEFLQLLRYEPGQFYRTHHDYIDNMAERQTGARILTVFLYLNDVEAGGGTNFDQLDVTVQPKRGRALIWPSVQNGSPNEKDQRTTHQALPVEAGIKYGANAWLHQRDFKGPVSQGCT